MGRCRIYKNYPTGREPLPSSRSCYPLFRLSVRIRRVLHAPIPHAIFRKVFGKKHVPLRNTQLMPRRNLESLSVDTDSDQCRYRLRYLVRRPLQPNANGDANSGLVTKYLTDSLATLWNLTTLNLDLHYACDISQTLGPSGTLILARLPNLQTLGVPFHFFVRKEPYGHHNVISPTSVLPRSLKTLRLVACFWCIGYRVYKTPRVVRCSCGSYRIRGYAGDGAPCKYQHPGAVLDFLEDIAELRAGCFPDLTNIDYEEGKPDAITHHHITWKCQHPPTEILMHGNRGTPDALRLTAVSERLRQSGVVLEMRATNFGCQSWWIHLDR